MKRFPQALKAARTLAKADKKFAKVIQHAGQVRIEFDENETIFEALASSIIYQQLHGKAAATILRRFKELFGAGDTEFPGPRDVLRAKSELLRTAGLSGAKAAAIQDLAEKILDTSVPERELAETLSDEDVIEALTRVKGIGPWTAQMVLIFTFGRTDVWPIADYGVRKGFAAMQGMKKMPTAKELDELGERYRPFRSAAAWYCWRALEMPEYKGWKERK